MFRLTIEKSLNHLINANNIDLNHIDNKIVSFRVDEIDLTLFFLCLNSRIFVIDNQQNKKVDVSVTLTKSSFVAIFNGASLEELVENEDKNQPFTDAQISELLGKDEYHIARRTVAKYREKIGIETAKLRRQI